MPTTKSPFFGRSHTPLVNIPQRRVIHTIIHRAIILVPIVKRAVLATLNNKSMLTQGMDICDEFSMTTDDLGQQLMAPRFTLIIQAQFAGRALAVTEK